jgi:hypothetical protein
MGNTNVVCGRDGRPVIKNDTSRKDLSVDQILRNSIEPSKFTKKSLGSKTPVVISDLQGKNSNPTSSKSVDSPVLKTPKSRDPTFGVEAQTPHTPEELPKFLTEEQFKSSPRNTQEVSFVQNTITESEFIGESWLKSESGLLNDPSYMNLSPMNRGSPPGEKFEKLSNRSGNQSHVHLPGKDGEPCCPRREQVQLLSKERNSYKKKAHFWMKKCDALTLSIKDQDLQESTLKTELSTLQASNQNLSQEHQSKIVENDQIRARHNSLEGKVTKTLYQLSQKIPQASNLNLQNFHTLHSLIETYEEVSVRCLNKTFRVLVEANFDEAGDRRDGVGSYLWPSGNVFYYGEFWDEKIWGKDIELLYDSQEKQIMLKICCVEGGLLDGCCGSLEVFGRDGIIQFIGGLKEGVRHGKGTEFWGAGMRRFEGEFLNGVRHGEGKEFYKSKEGEKLQFEGVYSNNVKNGPFVEYFESGKVRYKGSFVNDLRHGEGQLFYENGQVVYEKYDENAGKKKKVETLDSVPADLKTMDWVNGEISTSSVNCYNSDGSFMASNLSFKNGRVIGAPSEGLLYFQNGKNWMFRNAFYNEAGQLHCSKKEDLAAFEELIDVKNDRWGEQWFQAFMSPSQ